MTEKIEAKQVGNQLVLSRVDKSILMKDATAFLKSKGFKDYHGKEAPKHAIAAHGDKGKLVEVVANQIFIMVEFAGSSGRLTQVVDSQDAGKTVIEELMQTEYASYFYCIGTSFYICQDLVEFRVVHSDTSY